MCATQCRGSAPATNGGLLMAAINDISVRQTRAKTTLYGHLCLSVNIHTKVLNCQNWAKVMLKCRLLKAFANFSPP